MRPLLTATAALFIVTVAVSLDATAQQPAQPSAPAPTATPAAPPVAEATKKRRTARAKQRRTRYASLRNRMYSPCEIIDGWRAFPTRDRHSYFDTARVCRRY